MRPPCRAALLDKIYVGRNAEKIHGGVQVSANARMDLRCRLPPSPLPPPGSDSPSRHSMTDLVCTYPILNGLILNGFHADARDQRRLRVRLIKTVGAGQRVYSPNVGPTRIKRVLT